MNYAHLDDQSLKKLIDLCLLQYKVTRQGYPDDLIREAMRRRR